MRGATLWRRQEGDLACGSFSHFLSSFISFFFLPSSFLSSPSTVTHSISRKRGSSRQQCSFKIPHQPTPPTLQDSSEPAGPVSCPPPIAASPWGRLAALAVPVAKPGSAPSPQLSDSDSKTAEDDDDDDDDDNLSPVEHFTYNANQCTIKHFVSEPQPSSPILSAWKPKQPIQDYNVPYHPSLHKDIEAWSQILIDQVRQQSASTEVTVERSIVDIVPSSVAPEAAVATKSPTSTSVASITPTEPWINRHFLFQTHHRNTQGNQTSQPSSSSPPQRRTRRLSNAIARPLKRVARLVKRAVLSCTDNEHLVESRVTENIATTSPPTNPAESCASSNHSPPPTKVSTDTRTPDDIQPQPHLPKLGDTLTKAAKIKMLNIVDKIKNHTQQQQQQQQETQDHEEITQSHISSNIDTNSGTTNPAPIVEQAPAETSMKPVRERGPRMHPRLLELYEVTDKVLGVGTFATVKEIKLKSTGQSFALKIILKKTLKGNRAYHLGQVMEAGFSIQSN